MLAAQRMVNRPADFFQRDRPSDNPVYSYTVERALPLRGAECCSADYQCAERPLVGQFPREPDSFTTSDV